MPTYDYRCKSCGFEFEEFQSMSAEMLVICPKCAEPALKRLMSSGAGLVFKGSGFYLTDYKKSNVSPSASSSADTKSETKAESKSETKPKSQSEAQSDSKSKSQSKADSKPSTDSASGTEKK
jgi:putative FmdB family regulatory protein